MDCEVCGSRHQVSGHHLISYKSRPDLDCERNMIALCFKHHREVHDIGLRRFAEKYELELTLIKRGFELNHITNKWFLKES